MKHIGISLLVFCVGIGTAVAQSYEYSVQNRTAHSILFEVPSNKNVHQVVLAVHSATEIGKFALSLNDGAYASEDFTDMGLNIIDKETGAPENTIEAGSEGKFISLYQDPKEGAEGFTYVVDIVEKQTSVPRGRVLYDEVWTLDLSEVAIDSNSETNSLQVSIGCREADADYGPYVTWGPPGIPYQSPDSL